MARVATKDEWSEIELEEVEQKNVEKETIVPEVGTKLRSRLRYGLAKYAGYAQKMVLPRSHIQDRVDGEMEQQYNCWPPTIAIILLTVVEVSVFAYYISTQGEKVPNSPLVYDPSRRYEAWRFVTYMLIHASYEHIICNVVLQLVLGVPLEMVHKFWRVCTIYLCGVLAGALATSICDPTTFLVGASGGVYALITAHVASIIMNYSEMDFYPVWQLAFFIIVMVADVAVAVYKRYTDDNDRTGYAAHIAGSLVGLLLGVVALRNLRTKQWEKVAWWLCLDLLIVLMATMVVWNLAVPSYFLPAT